jgi:hypothetical protein
MIYSSYSMRYVVTLTGYVVYCIMFSAFGGFKQFRYCDDVNLRFLFCYL